MLGILDNKAHISRGSGNHLRKATLALMTLLLTSTLAAETLESKNPFLPPGYGKKEASKPAAPVAQVNGPMSRELEFRGIVQMNGIYQFSIFNKKESKGYWLKESESADGISIRSFDLDSQSITVTMNGRSERLSLMSSSDAPLPVAASKTSPGNSRATANPPVLPPNRQNVNNTNGSNTSTSRVIPRRRVILPKK